MPNPILANIVEALEIEGGYWSNDNWWTSYVNGIKFEVKKQRKGLGLTVAYHSETHEYADIFEANFPDFEPNHNHGVYYWFNTGEELEAFAFAVRDFIISEGVQRVTRAQTARKTEDNRLFEKTASAIKVIVENEAWDFLSGRLTFFDAHDEVITIGKSKAVIGNPDAPQWREHIVPCVMIRDEAIRMVEAGNSVTEIAQMLKENLSIVIITASEAKWLDSMYQTTMPEGWNFGDSKFARLDAANIAY